jgi:hypothetical protein
VRAAPDREPYLSVVVATRNDDHGGNLLDRTQIFLDGLAAQANRHRVDTELVIVEWNPPADRPPLVDVLRWPDGGEHFGARIVEVPERIHRSLDHADRLPLFQMIAKNVGIRRSRGRFVLATNVDLLLGDRLMAFLARRQLREDALYRVDRFDVDAGVPADASIEEQLAWCDANLLRICRRDGTLDVRSGEFYRIYENLRVPLWLAPWLRIFRFARRRASARVRATAGYLRSLTVAATSTARAMARLVVAASRQLALLGALAGLSVLLKLTRFLLKIAAEVRRRRRTGKIAVVVLRRVGRLREQLADAAASLRAKMHGNTDQARRTQRRLRRRLRRLGRHLRRLLRWRPVRRPRAETLADMRSLVSLSLAALRLVFVSERARLRLHTNACGDFTLLSRAAWDRVGGYPELELFSMHLDSLFLYQAHYRGIRESFLPYRVYHLEHDHGFRPDTQSLAALNARLARAAIPQISNEEFLSWVSEMYSSKKPKFSSRADWGFARAALDERVIVKQRPALREEPAWEVPTRV